MLHSWEKFTVPQHPWVKANSISWNQANIVLQFQRIAPKHSCQTHLILLEQWIKKNREVFLSQFLNGEREGRGVSRRVCIHPRATIYRGWEARHGKMKTLALLKSNLEWLTCLPPNDEGVPWPAERKRTPFSIHLAMCPDLIQPKSLPNPNLSPAN